MVMAAPAFAQQGIYTCVDAKGRRITADRPIPECLDREQKELTPGGTVKRKVAPVQTADERAAEEARAAKALEDAKRAQEDKKRDRALVARFPERAIHDKERAQALQVLEDVIAAASKNKADLVAQRKKLDIDLEFFRADPSKVPPKLKRQIEENQQLQDNQRRFIANQEVEKQRINARYDEELSKLKPLWAALAVPPKTAAASSPSKP
jgi:hypothetical protein